MDMGGFNVIMQGVDMAMDYIGARKQNQQARYLQRNQQNWEEMMSNTAISRRVDDLKRAGLNPVLAAAGPGASTPSVAPAPVQQEVKGGIGGNLTHALLLSAQIKQMEAQTKQIEAVTKGQDIRNNVDNAFAYQKAGEELSALLLDNDKRQYELVNLLPEMVKKAIQENANLSTTGARSHAELQNYYRMADDLVRALRLQVREKEIDLKALENIASIGGVEAGKATSIVKTLIDAIRVFMMRKD